MSRALYIAYPRSLYALALACLMSACGGSDDDLTFVAGPCPSPKPPGLIEGKDYSCGTVSVPESRAKSDAKPGRQLALAVLRLPPKAGTKKEPVVHLLGGPGVSYSAFYAAMPFLTGLAESTGREQILFDQRGIGFSSPNLDCKTEAALTEETLNACLQRFVDQGTNLAAYNTVESAHDVADIASAMGFRKVNLYGASYGTALGLAVMREHPEIVRSVVLESVSSPPYDVFFTSSPGSLTAALGRVFADCASDAACKAAFPDPAADLANILLEFEQEKATAPPEQWQQAATGLVQALQSLTQYTRGTSYVPLLLKGVATGDQSAIDKVIPVLEEAAVLDMTVDAGFTVAQNIAVNCQDEALFSTAARYEAANGAAPPLFREVMDPGLLEAAQQRCRIVGKSVLPPAAFEPVRSDLPTFIITGTHDSNTPFETAEKVKADLSKSQMLAVRGWGHLILPFGNTCALAGFNAFLRDPLAPIDTSCGAAPPAFATSSSN